MNREQILTQCRSQDNLNDQAATTWTDADLQGILDTILTEIAQRQALQLEACFPLTIKDFDISSLTRLVKVYQVENPVGDGSNDPVFRLFKLYGNIIKIDRLSKPNIVSGVLTGTVSFTKGSQSVTGSGTLFTKELPGIYLIGLSTGSKFYLVSDITSDTALTLDMPYEEESTTDTATKYRNNDGCARLHYGKEYTVTRSQVAFYGTGLNDLTAGKSFSGTGEISYVVKIYGNGSPDTFKWSYDGGTTWSGAVNCATTAVALNNSMSVLWAASTGHTIGDYWIFIAKPSDLPGNLEPILIKGIVANAGMQYASFLAAAETALSQPNLATTGDLTQGRPLINTLNLGGASVAPAWAQYAQIDIAEAQARIMKGRELKSLFVVKFQEYKQALASLYRISDNISYNYSRD